MKTLRLLPFLLAVMLTGCTFFIRNPIRKETEANFPGGIEAMFEYLSQNLKYPQAAIEARIEGTVYVKFIIEEDGSISNIEVIQSHLGGGCEEAAMNAVRNMPNWNPGTRKGKPVPSIFVLPVQFQLTE